MAYQLNGTIKLIYDTQTFPSGFSKREFVVTTDDKFPQDIKLECLKEKGALLDNVKEGERVDRSFRPQWARVQWQVFREPHGLEARGWVRQRNCRAG